MSDPIRFDAEGKFRGEIPTGPAGELPAQLQPRHRTGRTPAERELNALVTREGLSPWERLQLVLSFRAEGRPGATLIRERQERVRTRLAKLGQPAPSSHEGGHHSIYRTAAAWRAGQLLGLDRNQRRAEESGDADVALALGESYHRRVRKLYRSERAEVRYGRGGQQESDNTIYRGRFKGWRANWQHAGARVEYPTHLRHRGGPGIVILETYRGTEVARLPLPPAGAVCNHQGLLDGDLFAIPRQIGDAQVALRYGAVKVRGQKVQQYYRTGVALRCLVPVDCREQGPERWEIFRTTTDHYWEHGPDLDACRAEYARKLALVEADRLACRESDRLSRAAARIARLCPNLIVTDQDRAQAGYCLAGTHSFLDRYGLSGRATLTAIELQRTGRPEVEQAIRAAALRVAKQRFVQAS